MVVILLTTETNPGIPSSKYRVHKNPLQGFPIFQVGWVNEFIPQS